MAAARMLSSRCILSDVMVVNNVIHFKTLQFPEWRKSLLQESKNLNKRNLWQQQGRRAEVCT